MSSSENNQAEAFHKENNSCTSVNIEEIVYDESSDQQSESMDLDQQSGENVGLTSNTSCPVLTNVDQSTKSVQNFEKIDQTVIQPSEEVKSASAQKNEPLEETQPASRFRRARIRDTIEQWSAHRIVSHDSRVKAVPSWVHELHKKSNQMQDKLKFALDRRLYCYFCMKVNSYDLGCKNVSPSCTKCLVKMETLEALQDAASLHRQWLMQASISINNQCKKNPNEIQKPAILDEHEKLFEKWENGQRRDVKCPNESRKKNIHRECNFETNNGRLDILAHYLMKEFSYRGTDGPEIVNENCEFSGISKVPELERRKLFYSQTFGYSHQDPNAINTYDILEKNPQLFKYYPFNGEGLEGRPNPVHQVMSMPSDGVLPMHKTDPQMQVAMKQRQSQPGSDLPVNSHLMHQYQGPMHPHPHVAAAVHSKMHHPLHTARFTRIPKNSYNQLKDGPSEEFLLLTTKAGNNLAMQTTSDIINNGQANMHPTYALQNQFHSNSIQYSMENIGPVLNHHGNSSLSIDVGQQKAYSKADQNFHHINDSTVQFNPAQRHFLPPHVIDLQSSAPPTSPAIINGAVVNNPKSQGIPPKNTTDDPGQHNPDVKQMLSPPTTPHLIDEKGNKLAQPQQLTGQMQSQCQFPSSTSTHQMMNQLSSEASIANQQKFQQQLLNNPALTQVKNSVQLHGANTGVTTSSCRTNSLPMHGNQLHQNISIVNPGHPQASTSASHMNEEMNNLVNSQTVGGGMMMKDLVMNGVQGVNSGGSIQMIPNTIGLQQQQQLQHKNQQQNMIQSMSGQTSVVTVQKSNRFSVTTANTHSNPSMESSVYNSDRPVEKASNSQPGEQVDYHQTHSQATTTSTSTTSVTSTSISQPNLNDPMYNQKVPGGVQYKRISSTGITTTSIYQQPHQKSTSPYQSIPLGNTEGKMIPQGYQSQPGPSNPNITAINKHQMAMSQQMIASQAQPMIMPISTVYKFSHQQQQQIQQNHLNQQKQALQQQHQQHQQQFNTVSGVPQMLTGEMEQGVKMYNQMEFMNYEAKFNATVESMKRALLKCSEEEISRLSNELNSMRDSYNEVNSRLMEANRMITDYQKILTEICKHCGLNYNEFLKNQVYRQQKQNIQPQTPNDPYLYQQMQQQAQMLSNMTVHTGQSTPSSSVTSNPPHMHHLSSNQSNNFSGQMNNLNSQKMKAQPAKNSTQTSQPPLGTTPQPQTTYAPPPNTHQSPPNIDPLVVHSNTNSSSNINSTNTAPPPTSTANNNSNQVLLNTKNPS